MTTTQQQTRALGATPDRSAIAMRTGAAHADARNARGIAGDILDSARGNVRIETLAELLVERLDHAVATLDALYHDIGDNPSDEMLGIAPRKENVA